MYALYIIFILANLLMIPLGIVMIRLASNILRAPRAAIMPVIVLLCGVGSFATGRHRSLCIAGGGAARYRHGLRDARDPARAPARDDGAPDDERRRPPAASLRGAMRCLCLVIHAPHDLRVDEREVEGPGPGEVAVRIGYGGICGSDLHYYHDGGFGTVRIKRPMTLGHEVAGTVHAVGEGVTRVKPGDRVAVNPSRSCAACVYCLEGLPNQCLDMRFYGSAMRDPHVEGAFRQLLVCGEVQCEPVAAQVLPLPRRVRARRAPDQRRPRRHAADDHRRLPAGAREGGLRPRQRPHAGDEGAAGVRGRGGVDAGSAAA